MTNYNVYFMDKGYHLRLIGDNYSNNGAPYFGLIDANDGEPYADITTNIPPYTDSNTLIALDNDFMSCCTPQLISDVIAELTDGFVGNVQSGFVEFPLYYLKNCYKKEDKNND